MKPGDKHATPGVIMLILVALLALPASAQDSAQEKRPAPCSQPEAQQFDFWIGAWDLAWGEGAGGRNVIEKTLGNCVIVENFDGSPATPLRGMSVSTYNARLQQWQQTWVDNQGSYLDFTGGWQDSRMVLQREATVDGSKVLQRMVWFDITPDALRWNWERSVDDGATWEVLWAITYTRAEAQRPG